MLALGASDQSGSSWGAGNVLFLYLGAHYLGMLHL